MEACSNTLTRSGQGTYELAVSFGEEGGRDGGFMTCKKNPGHEKFIPINELSQQHLLPEHRHKYYGIQHLAAMTVKVSVNYVSPHRPARFPLSEFSGNEVLSVGSGFVTDITDGEMTCPINKCSELPGYHPVPGYITITTAAHVVCDDAEAERTTVEFFYDNPGDKSGVRTCRGVKLGTVDVEGDFCELLCVTHDRKVHDRIKCLLSTPQLKLCSIFDRFPCLNRISIKLLVDKGLDINVVIFRNNEYWTSFKDLMLNDFTKIFAPFRGRNLWHDCGFTEKNLRIDRFDSENVIVRSGNRGLKLNIYGTARFFDDLDIDIPRKLQGVSSTRTFGSESRCSTDLEKKIILERQAQEKDIDELCNLMLKYPDVNEYPRYETGASGPGDDEDEEQEDDDELFNLLGTYSSVYDYSHFETGFSIYRFGSILRRIDARRTKFWEYLGILNYRQPSFVRAIAIGEFCVLKYHCATDLWTRRESPAAKGEDSTAAKGEDSTADKGEDSTSAKGEDSTAAKGEDSTADKGEDSTADKGEERDNSLIVHISHPHGQSKMVSLGSLTECFTGNGYYCPLYTAPTCPGSSGGPTFVLPETDDLSQIYGMPHRSCHGNMLSEGSGWTLYPSL